MKKLLLVAALGLSAVTGYSQGQVNFNNFAGTYAAPIYGINPGNPTRQAQGQGSGDLANPMGGTSYAGHPLLTGTGFTAQLWGGPDAANLAAPAAGSGTQRFSTIAGFGGYLSSGVTATFPGHAAGTTVTLQVRAWDNRNNTVTSWAAVLADPTVPRGWSTTFQSPSLTVAPSTPPTTPGMTSFNLFVPEPSVIALGALGLGALLLRRFRR
jgi:hypothetical protein